ncbi:tripartite tricarboxylate transporter substrate binding protein [Variovorax paradoxus]|uniref:Tripartite tricarboxylate transporter family receptor n=1 Tax=Variovorax paradoxus TaxID=34073 RepID=A0A0H2LR30_VARPD|nr:tripartite tricarboxylate transporter substrate binding protein [Variovorax paradoxus]KLN52694.1 tripartite tricarboxylate transporter family receptor [Variovorax paradoxus]
MKITSRRDILKIAAAGSAVSLFGQTAAFAQGVQFPVKPISLLVGYPPGGLTDAGARFAGRGMATALGQPVLIENKPGASGNIAAAEVQRMSDPYRLLVANTSFTINPHTYATPSPVPTDFAPIGLILESQLVLCVNPAAPVKNLGEFVAWVKAESAKGFSYASSGSGGNTHLAMEYFRERMALPAMSQVPYRGSAPAIQDVVGNQVPCMMDAASLLIPFIASGKLRPIFVTGNARLPALPDVPTATELGVKDFVVTVFVGLWGAPKLPASTVAQLNAALNAALSDPAVASQITKNGDVVGGGSPERLGALTRENYKLWGEVARRNNIRAE